MILLVVFFIFKDFLPPLSFNSFASFYVYYSGKAIPNQKAPNPHIPPNLNHAPPPPPLPLFLLTSLLSPLTSAAWTCPSTYSAGPCFTSAKNWTDAQHICESHGSNLATVIDSSVNGLLGSGGCFSDAPWNDWECTWVGATDLRGEGTFEWASGAVFSYDEWGEYEPDATAGNAQDCAAVCKGALIPFVMGLPEQRSDAR